MAGRGLWASWGERGDWGPQSGRAGRVASRTQGEAGSLKSECAGRRELNAEEMSLWGSSLKRAVFLLKQGMLVLRRCSGV